MNKKNKKSFLGGTPRTFLVGLLVLIGSLFALHMLTDRSRNIKTLTYSAFLTQVEQDQVKRVHVVGQEVYGFLKDGTRFETTIANKGKDWEILRAHNVEFSVDSPNQQFNFWYLLPLLSFLITGWAIWYFIRQSRGSGGGGGNSIFTMGKSKAKLFMPSTIKETFDSVAGAAEAKEDLQEIIDFLKHPEKYSRLGAKIPRGVLLTGAPGNGKTLLARATAGEANCPFFSISGSDFIEVFVGVGAARVRDLFEQARKHAPCIIFIDEIDAVGRHRGSGLGGGHDEREQTLNQMLAEMDGFQTNNSSVIVIAATNRSDVLDHALLRPGRFDRRILVPYPDLKSREKILEVHAKAVKMDPAVDLHKIARGTPGFSGAELANLINEAAILASKTDQQSVTINDFEEARDKILLGKEIKSLSLTDEDRKVTSYHESGHALVRLMMPEDSDPLHKVTIIPRGKALGVTHAMPEREKYTRTRDEILADVMSGLGGRASEELIFKKATTGAYSDFKAATAIVRDMVCNYGMAEELGQVVYAQSQGEYMYSQKTAERIDEQVQKIMDDCYTKTMKLLTDNRDKLEQLATTLLEKETLYADEIYELLGIEPRTQHRFS
ncbi:ATP-dependent metallopeptidase FtsH/Yme1/Tma family protein [Candidatus Dependentiae bacterium]|nr:MAG: ATP-dependent metallopeptidase FtsH/Yme1/Tma family protein [Candidatus Dependentiae bacterium]